MSNERIDVRGLLTVCLEFAKADGRGGDTIRLGAVDDAVAELIAERDKLANIVRSHEAQIVRMAAERAGLIEAAKAIKANPHVDLGDLVYQVREREGEGWDGASVKQWSDAVQAFDAALARIGGAA